VLAFVCSLAYRGSQFARGAGEGPVQTASPIRSGTCGADPSGPVTRPPNQMGAARNRSTLIKNRKMLRAWGSTGRDSDCAGATGAIRRKFLKGVLSQTPLRGSAAEPPRRVGVPMRHRSSGKLRQDVAADSRDVGRESPEGEPESRLWLAVAGRTQGCVNGPARKQGESDDL
jgi:hypothetical protein